METFHGIHLDLSDRPGKCRFAETGLGWKSNTGGTPFTFEAKDIFQAQWSLVARGYELKIVSRNGQVYQLDGFQNEDFERVSKPFKNWYGVNLDHRDRAVRGWNWGKAEFSKAELVFNIQSRPAFEIPFEEISNTNLTGRNEVSVELRLSSSATSDKDADTVQPQQPSDDKDSQNRVDKLTFRGKKAMAASDELMEIRFYIPGLAKIEKKNETDQSDYDAEEQSAANVFYDTLIEKANIGEVSGDTIASFKEILNLTPRGRFDIDMYENDFRLRGKTYDYKIAYDSIKKVFLLPKPDELHMMITIGLDPPIRQGQTRYPFLVMQFKRDEEVMLDLNMSEDDLNREKYKGKLQASYEMPIAQVIASLFRGLAGKKVITPSKGFVSHYQQSGVKCSIKANEGHLFCFDKSFLFVPKPTTYIPFENIESITMSRVGAVVSSSRTFDILVTLRSGLGEHQFSNINREEQAPLEEFFRVKNLKTKNEIMGDDSSKLLAAALKEQGAQSSSDEDGRTRDRGSAGEDDDDSVDESFQASSESEVAEEYDSAHESSGSESGSDNRDDGDDEDDTANVDADDGDEDSTADRKVRPKKSGKAAAKSKLDQKPGSQQRQQQLASRPMKKPKVKR